MVDADRLLAAYETARCDLLAECDSTGHWIGQLASSALSTATAVSALALVHRQATSGPSSALADDNQKNHVGQLIVRSLRWLVKQQNADGGWGDTDKSLSNIATTMLVRAAFHLTGVPGGDQSVLERADEYIEAQGGIDGLRRRYGRDKSFAVPILANCALAGLVSWREVPALPFELACFSQETWKFLRLPVVSYAVPALVAIGQLRYHFRKPWNPLVRFWRGLAVEKSLKVLNEKQPESGGFLEAVPLTSFVVMSLVGMGRSNHEVVRRGVQFLLSSVRGDGSWPIDTNLSTWNTTLAINALATGGDDIAELGNLDWLLACQHRETHPYTGAAPGGWSWTDLSGGVPNADDTASALLALTKWRDHPEFVTPSSMGAQRRADAVRSAALAGVTWLLDMQNTNGGWPTFCKGWGRMPFDRSGADLTANVLRALHAWRKEVSQVSQAARQTQAAEQAVKSQSRQAAPPSLETRLNAAIESGVRYLTNEQRQNGSWDPLWFGNQYHAEEKNPVYGTARVLLAFRDLNRLDQIVVRRGLDWLVTARNRDGGWGGRPASDEAPYTEPKSSVEETALAVEALLSCGLGSSHEMTAHKGLKWLADAVEANRHHEISPIGFYFAKVWYYEKLYPLIFTVAALGEAVRRLGPQTLPQATLPLGKA